MNRRPTRAQRATAEFRELRADPAMLRGALSSSPDSGFLRLLAAGHSVAIDDGGADRQFASIPLARRGWRSHRRARVLGRVRAAFFTARGHRPRSWSAQKSAEMDREDRLAARRAA